MKFLVLKLSILTAVSLHLNSSKLSVDCGQLGRSTSAYQPLGLLFLVQSPFTVQDLETDDYIPGLLGNDLQKTDVKDTKRPDFLHFNSRYDATDHQNNNKKYYASELWKKHRRVQASASKNPTKFRINKRVPVQCLLNIVACWKK